MPVWITVSGDSEQSLFRELAYLTQIWLVEQGYHVDRLQSRYDALVASTIWDDMRMHLKTYLKQLQGGLPGGRNPR